MRSILIGVVILLGSLNAMATSYGTSPVAGFLTWNSAWATDYWTPRTMFLSHAGGDPNMWPGTFSSSSLMVTCIPTCGIGDKFTIDLSLTNFSSGLGNLAGTINLVTAPVVIGSQSGSVIAHFNLTGILCGSSNCSNGNYFALNVNVHGFATLAYNMNSGQLNVSSVAYALPEPSSLILLATGLLCALGRFRIWKNSH